VVKVELFPVWWNKNGRAISYQGTPRVRVRERDRLRLRVRESRCCGGDVMRPAMVVTSPRRLGGDDLPGDGDGERARHGYHHGAPVVVPAIAPWC
jgi:hypothetical protein